METVKTPIMPRKLPERLAELEPAESILISQDTRHSWASAITRAHKLSEDRQFTIRTNSDSNEIRVWRLK
jgi:hypothetical protein